MRIPVRLFAILRERAASDRIEIDLPGDSASLSEILAAIGAAVPAIAPLLPMVRVAVNERFADANDRFVAGDDVALIPPVSGGSGRDRLASSGDPASPDRDPLTGLGLFDVRERALALDEVVGAVEHPSAGAISTFSGVVRDRTGEHEVVALEYEAYAAMAVRTLRGIGDEIQSTWPLTRVAILHRIGRLAVGEVSVVIAVSSPHRADAFAACRQVIERLKQDVPIWKKEIRRDGSIWVGIGS